MTDEILFRYFSDKATEEEIRQIEDWLDADLAHQHEFDAAHSLFAAMVLRGDELKSIGSLAAADSADVSAVLPGKVPVWRRAMRYAAAVAVMLVTGLSGMLAEREVTYHRMTSQVNVIEVPAGQMMAMTLPDGTEIHLNGGSRLEYPMVFAREQRRVKLSGEALLEVSHDVKHPFVVETFASEIEVLGTKFNVHADEEDGYFSTTLVNGKVRVSTIGEDREQVVLSPDEKVRMVDNHLVVSRVSAADAISWTDGFINLKDVDFEELVCRLESMYRVNIVIERDTMPEVHFVSGKIRVSEGLDIALRILQRGGDFTYEKDSDSNTVVIR